MKISKFFLAMLLFIPFLQSCQNDVTDTGDPRDAIAKKWRVVDDYDATGALGYDVTISKDAAETTRIIFTNFGNFGTSGDKLYATIANKKITIPTTTLDGTYTITNGTGTISNDLNSIDLTYDLFDGDVTKSVTANFGQNFVKKKAVKKAK
jgi:hypothetical protein